MPMPITANEARVKSVAARIQRLAAAEEAQRMEEAERVRKLKRVENELVPQCLRDIDELILAAANKEKTSCVYKGQERRVGADEDLMLYLENLILEDLKSRGFVVKTYYGDEQTSKPWSPRITISWGINTDLNPTNVCER